MHLVEQAIFTSTQTAQGDGYQLAARSSGVTEDEAQELSVWGPSHDSLRDPHAGATCYNYFPLPGGKFCVSRTVADGAEYSRRGGYRVTTQFLLVPAVVANRFGNSPLAIVKAALADGVWRRPDERLKHLPAINLTGKASIIDRTAIDRVRVRIGPDTLAIVVEAVLSHAPVLLMGGPTPELVMAALISCLPPECRGELSFTTGLRYSHRRPFRLMFAPHDPKERRQVVRQTNSLLIDLSRKRTLREPLNHGWAQFIVEVLESGRVSALSAQFMQSRPGLQIRDMDLLGQQLLFELKQWQQPGDDPVVAPPPGSPTDRTDKPARSESSTPPTPALAPADSAAEDDSADDSSPNDIPALAIPFAEPLDTSSVQHIIAASAATTAPVVKSHAAHLSFEQSRRAVAELEAEGVAARKVPRGAVAAVHAAPSRGPAQEALEILDDLAFAAIEGDTHSLAQFKAAWPEVVAELGADIVEESREQYLRRALAVWNEVGGDPPRDPRRAATALDILCLLLGDNAA